jgi:glucose-1-phosphate thymidylyltransferase
MRRADAGTQLGAAESAVADVGLKAMIPVGEGRPFADYVLTALADAGITDVCLVIGPEHESLRSHYSGHPARERLHISFAVQPEPRGTADAVLAAAQFVGSDSFLALNSDNYYPAEVLRELRAQPAPALPAFAPGPLSTRGNIPATRIMKFALLEIGADGRLIRLYEKPTPGNVARLGDAAPVSMNVWLLDERMLQACREVPHSPRGEYELPLAVQYAIDAWHVHVHTFPVAAAVLDLSERADVAAVQARLRDVPVRL